MKSSDRRPQPWTAYCILALTLATPALGGTTTFWAQASLLIATALLFIFSPPKTSLGLVYNSLFVGIGAIALAAFLPAHWFASPEWRTGLLQAGVPLPSTYSPQPWSTFEATCLLWLGLAWTYYLFSHTWTNRVRQRLSNGFCLGMLTLAGTLIIAYTFKARVPFWPNVPEFGFFPNRNQTSNVLALAGILIYANAFQNLQSKRKQGWIWLTGLGLIGWALILNYSRAGLILFFAGILAWHAWWLFSTEERIRTKSFAWLPIAILLAMLLLAGGDTLLRFTRGSAGLLSADQNGRIPIQHDALQLWLKSPFVGIGLGNFRGIFTSARQYFISPSEAIHPESDWLWCAVEMGAASIILLITAMGIGVRRCFPFSPGTWRRMRFAALICGIAFACHGFVDVPGHRIGSLWPALFLMSTALYPATIHRPSKSVSPIFRLLALGFLALGVSWFAAMAGRNILPTTAQIEPVKRQIGLATEAQNYERVIALASEGLKIAPLDWELYHLRGVAEATAYRPRAETNRDFAAARYLLPNWPDLWSKEGQVWLALDEPDQAFSTWEEGMKRWPDNAPELYRQLFSLVQSDADLRDRWRKLGESDAKLLPILFLAANGAEFRVELDRIFSMDPELRTLTRPEQRALFSAWYRVGDRLALAEVLREHPAWEDIAWPELARAYADLADYHQAYDLALHHCPPISLPAALSPSSINSLAARFRLGKTTEHEGLVLAISQNADGRSADALETAKVLSTQPKASRLVHFVESQMWANQQTWQKAWDALSKCIPDD